jgi:D-alanyl-D-alanine carboxypeptidase
MAHTVFRNASGLPDPRQVTTARDMATLSLRIQRDFPQYYPYFRTMSFRFNGKLIKTHNRLLGRFAGTDGIKTGYIRASGFNLTSSVKRGEKRIIGVVMGARSGGARNAYMMSMLNRVIPNCKPGKTLAVAVQGVTPKPAADVSEIEIADAKAPAPKGKKQNDAATAIPPAAELLEPEQESDQDSDEDAAEAAENGVTPGDSASLDDAIVAASRPTVEDTPEGDAEDQGSTLLTKTAPDGSPLPFAVKPPGADGGVVVDPPTMTSWTIQIGAYPDKKDAQNILYKLRDLHLDVLEEKEAVTIEVQKGSNTLYRARFSGFSESDARIACKHVSARGFGCVAFGPQS